MRLILIKISDIFHIIRCLHFTFSFSFAIEELPFVEYFIFPSISAFSIRFPIFIIALESVSVWECLFAFAVLEELFEESLKSLPVRSHMNSITLNFTLSPLSDITVSLARLPYSWSFFESVSPLALIALSIFPFELSLTISLAVLELTFVIALNSNLISLDYWTFMPNAFIKHMLFSDEHPESTPFIVKHFSKI